MIENMMLKINDFAHFHSITFAVELYVRTCKFHKELSQQI